RSARSFVGWRRTDGEEGATGSARSCDLALSPPLSTQPLLSYLLCGSPSSSGRIQPHSHLLLPSLIPLCVHEMGQAGTQGKGRRWLRRGRRRGGGGAVAAGGGRPRQRRQPRRVPSPSLLLQEAGLD
uniref:Uncharacterized protein n=4 Tax=Aegilops tauschii subsp. strangulata TaxID=200361 RepID=A0A453R3R0_AEGTS